MSTPTLPLPPAGSDGVEPLYDPSRGWRLWNVNELYLGPLTPGTGKFVANVGDWAVDTTMNQFYSVTAIDPTTFVATLAKITSPIPDDQFTDTDRLLSPGPGPRPNTYLIYVNTNVKPTSACVDQRLFIRGTATKSATLVTGSVLDGTEKTISALVDQSGNIIGQSIPVEVQPDGTKVVPPFAITDQLPNGEIVTLILWSDTGIVCSRSELMVEDSSFIRAPSTGVKYVTGISLISPFLSPADPTKIIYPLNVPLNGLNLQGVVNYSDGSSITLPVDGTKFQLFGFNTGFVATVVGQKVPLVLRYNLSDGEVAYGVGDNGAGKFIVQEFEAITDVADGQYTVKLFCYPIWVDAVNGYRLRWFLFNLDRTQWYDVTAYINYLNAYNPTAYGVQQKIQVQLNLQSVNGTFKNFIFTQTVWVSLLNQGTERTTNWTIAFAPGQTPQFGVNNFAATTFINQNLWKINLAMGNTDLSDWLTQVYGNTLPLYDPAMEVAPPTPTHFSIVFNDGSESVFPISQWNQDLTVNEAVLDSSTLFVRFFERTPTTDLQLAMAGYPCYQQN
ncbi:MAG: hypothetical protein P4L77_11215 [Sulfuriferula sp.]|nr:hypothetical protein [Sulfuriferula sp.]